MLHFGMASAIEFRKSNAIMSSRRWLQPVQAKKSQDMFCTKDGRKYFDKTFKLLFHNNRPNEILAVIQNHTQNYRIDELAESSGETVLHLAAKYGIVEVITYLLSQGSEVDAQSADCGWTPLIMAAAYGHTDVCKLLMDANANMFTTDFFGESALYAAITSISNPYDHAHLHFFTNKLKSLQMEKGQLASMLMKANCPLYYIVQLNDSELTKTLRERGYTVSKSNKDDLLLVVAVSLKNLENVKFVLELMDIDVNFSDTFDYTPMHYAVENGDDTGSVSIIKYLLEKGANINVPGVAGMTPLCAVFNGFMTNEQKKYCIYFLLLHGADPQILDDNGDTIIDYGMDEAIEDYDETLLDPVISHLVLQEELGVPIVEKIRQQIDEEENLKYYYRFSKRCLQDMKKITISGQVTMYKLLSESEEQVLEYMRDVQVAKTFVHNIFHSNFYYRYLLNKRFIKVMDIIKREKQLLCKV